MLPQSSLVLALNSERLREARRQLGLSQAGFADEINAVLAESGQAARCTKRLVQLWESGDHSLPIPRYQKALAQVTGYPFMVLCQTATLRASTPTARELAEIAAELEQLMIRLGKVAARVGFSEL